MLKSGFVTLSLVSCMVIGAGLPVWASPQSEIKTYTQALNKAPNEWDTPEWQALTMRGNAYAQLKNYGQAFKDYNRVIDNNPNFLAAYKYRGILHEKLGQHPQALRDYTRMQEISAHQADGYMLRANLYLKKAGMTSNPDLELEFKKQAITDFSQAIRFNPSYYPAFFARARVLHKQGLYDLAVKDYSKVVSLNPNFREGYHYRASIYWMHDNLGGYIQDISALIRLAPNHLPYYMDRGVAYMKAGMYEQASEDFKMILAKQPKNKVAAQRLAQTKRALKDLLETMETPLAEDMPEPEKQTADNSAGQ